MLKRTLNRVVYNLLCGRKGSQSLVYNVSAIGAQYDTVKEIGRGSTGTVYKIKKKDSGRLLTCKKISKWQRYRAAREVNALRQISGSKLQKFHRKIEDELYICILSEYIHGMDLFNSIVDKTNMTEDQARPIVLQMALCIKQCLDSDVAHLDIKTENFIVVDPQHYKLMLIDFGTAHCLSRGRGMGLLKMPAGTHGYSPPEFYDGRFHRNSDIWSLGVCTWVLLTGGLPFSGIHKNIAPDILGNYNCLEFPTEEHKEMLETMSPDLRYLILQMLLPKPYARISIEEILIHPWIKNT